MMAIVSDKGGVGKTSSTIGIGDQLASMGKKVCLVDLDPKPNLTMTLKPGDYNEDEDDYLFPENSNSAKAFEEGIVEPLQIRDNLYLVGTDKRLYRFSKTSFEGLLSFPTAIANMQEIHNFDYIIYDVAGSLTDMLTVAFIASDYILIPVSGEQFSSSSLKKMIKIFQKLKTTGLCKHTNLLGAFHINIDTNAYNINKAYIKNTKVEFPNLMLNTIIHRTKINSESHTFSKMFSEYAPNSKIFKEYQSLVNEILSKISEMEECYA